jgi:serine/threonine-protein kinase
MGVVYLAYRERDGRAVALKLITPAVAATGNALAQFLREASVLRSLDHPGIVRFEEVGHTDGRIFLAMEYVDGCDAARLLLENGAPLPIPQAVDLVCQALVPLAYAHKAGYVHRDIKPHNLLVSTSVGAKTVKVADFGLARVYQSCPLSGLTLAGAFGGTAAFMAPEQITHFRESKPPVDQYALGATLYYLLTNRRVYDFPKGSEQQLLMILQADPVPICTRRGDIPAGLADVIHRALARDPAVRFADVQAMRKALLPFARAR